MMPFRLAQKDLSGEPASLLNDLGRLTQEGGVYKRYADSEHILSDVSTSSTRFRPLRLARYRARSA